MTDYTAALSDQLRLTIYHLPLLTVVLYLAFLSTVVYHASYFLNSILPKIQSRIGNRYIYFFFLSIPIHFRPTFFFVISFLFSLSWRTQRGFLVYFSCKLDIQLFIGVFLNENKDDNLFAHIYYKQILETDMS